MHLKIMYPISEIAFTGFSLMSVVATQLLFADTSPPAQQFALQWFLLPLLGSLAAAVCAFCFNPNPEARKTVLGRGLFGCVIGVGAPKIISIFHPGLKELSLDPSIVFFIGFCFAGFGYIISRPFVEKLFSRQVELADQTLSRIEHRVTLTTSETVTNPPAGVLHSSPPETKG